MQKPIFVREATGLVRQLSVVDAFIMNQGILKPSTTISLKTYQQRVSLPVSLVLLVHAAIKQ
jgi:hypothetical protein